MEQTHVQTQSDKDMKTDRTNKKTEMVQTHMPSRHRRKQTWNRYRQSLTETGREILKKTQRQQDTGHVTWTRHKTDKATHRRKQTWNRHA